MSERHVYAALITVLQDPAGVIDRCIVQYVSSRYRSPGPVNQAALAAHLRPLVEAFACAVLPGRSSQYPEAFELCPGCAELREVEQIVAFFASNAGASRLSDTSKDSGGLATGFDVGALLFSLRDILSEGLSGPTQEQFQAYMEWLVVLAGDSLAHGREHALRERFSHELDEGTPLLMITPQLPAVIFVCQPNRSVISGVLGRLLLTIVRTGAKAVIVDVRGMTGKFDPALGQSLELFFGHPRVGGKVTVFACGVEHGDVTSWRDASEESNTTLVFENYFDICVSSAMECGGWRLIPGSP